jgi:hypothetical protein
MLINKYPAPAPESRNLLIALVFGLFITLFLLFFEPFDINVASGKNSVFSLIIFGVITASTIALFFYFLPLFFTTLFDDSRWTLLHQISFCLLSLVAIATINGLYTNYINGLSFSWANYWWIINRTVVLGGIPFSFLILIDYRRKNQSSIETAHYILDRKESFDQSAKSTIWNIATDLKNETFSFDDQYFCHAVAAGNYIDLYAFDQGQLNCKTFRITLAAFEKQISANHLRRCHRSYLVNLKKVANVAGNAQGLKLTIDNHPEPIPVSRKYIPIVKHYFSAQS